MEETLTKAEAKVIGEMMNLFATHEREDVIGVLVKFGAFRYLSDDELVVLSRKLNNFMKLEL